MAYNTFIICLLPASVASYLASYPHPHLMPAALILTQFSGLTLNFTSWKKSELYLLIIRLLSILYFTFVVLTKIINSFLIAVFLTKL